MPTPIKAIPCQGFTFTWGTSALYNVQQLEVNYQRGLPVGRTKRFSKSPGQVNLIGFSAVNLPESEYGRKRQLKIECPSDTSGNKLTLIDKECIYTDMSIRAQANDSVQFAYTFMMLDTSNGALNDE